MTQWARHLDAAMRERGWSRVRLFEEVGGELGYSPKSRSGFLPLLEDREPTPAQADVLRRHFGDPPEALKEPAPDSAHTEGAGSDLAAAIRDLTVELAENRKERTVLAARLLELEAVVRVLVERANEVGGGLPFPDPTAGANG